jgi:MFS family permease
LINDFHDIPWLSLLLKKLLKSYLKIRQMMDKILWFSLEFCSFPKKLSISGNGQLAMKQVKWMRKVVVFRMMESYVGLSREVKRNFEWDMLSGAFMGLFIGVINAFILVQARRIGANPFQVSFLAAIPFIWMFLSPLWVVLFRGKSPFQMVLICDGIGRLLLILLLVNRTPDWYLLLFSINYLMNSISGTLYGRAMEQAYPGGARATLMGWVRVGLSLTSLLSTAVAGVLLPHWGVQRVFACAAVFGIGAAWTFGQLRRIDAGNDSEPDNKPDSPSLQSLIAGYGSSLRILREDKLFRDYMIALFLFGIANLMGAPLYALYQVDHLKVSDGFIAVLALVNFGASLIAYFIGGRFIDQNTPFTMTIRIFAISPLIPLIYLLAGNPWLLLPAAALQGIVNAGIDLASLNNVIHFANSRGNQAEVGPYMGVHMNLLGIRGTVGPLMIPVLVPLITIKGVIFLLFMLFLAGLWAGAGVLRTGKNNH